MNSKIFKKGISFFFLCLICLFVIDSCQKKYDKIKDEYSFINSVEKKLIIDWIDQQKLVVLDKYKSRIDSLLYFSQWDKAISVKTAKDGYMVIYIPQKNKSIALSIFYDQNKNKIDSGNMVFVGTKVNTNPIEGVKAYFNGVFNGAFDSDFSGFVTTFTIYNKFKYEYGFRNGRILWRGIEGAVLKKGQKPSLLSLNEETYNVNGDCQWWGHYTLWSSGLVTLDYIYLKCFCEEQTTSIPIGDGQYLQINCGGQGGAPSTSESYPETAEILAFEQDYRGKMSTQEIEIFDSMSRTNQLAYLFNAKSALDRAAQLFPTSTYNGVGDAFRHAYFSALNVRSLGYDLAKRLGDAHELKQPPHPLEREMDLRNNQIGRDLGFALTQMYPVFSGDPHYFFMALNQQLHSLISSGGLWRLSPLENGDGGRVIDGVTQLIKTN